MISEYESALQRIHNAARQAGLQCSTETWRGWQARYALICEKGHRFTRVGSALVFHSAVCVECQNDARLVRLQLAAQAKGGTCLEHRYLGSAVPHRFTCRHGHQWKTTPSKVTSGSTWCLHCARAEHAQRLRKPDGLAQLQRRAAEKGGVCLSDTYTVGKAHYQFKCAQGHQWQAAGNEVMRGAWCRQCANAARRQNYLLSGGLQRLQKRAGDHGGECLAQTYTGDKARYRFRCMQGHEWETTGKRILRGAWCAQCHYDRRRLGIDLMRQIARDRGGDCLSTYYVNSATKLHWECHRGHRWHAIPGAIRKGHWCPVCGHLAQIRHANSKARLKYQAIPDSRRHRL